jgi:glycosyltransferase involved in cell wall biosynthesis
VLAAHRIGVLAPPWLPIPPPAYGGIEQVVALLCDRLSARGHEVVLVAAPGSGPEAAEIIAPLEELPLEIGSGLDELSHVLGGLEALDGCDAILDHSGPLGALLASRLGVPVLHVVHGPIDARMRRLYGLVGQQSPGLRLVAISRAQAAAAPELPVAGVAYNGLDVEAVPFRAQPDDHLAFLGRMAPEKGAAEAIAIARRAGRRLKIAAKCREPAEREYFERAVAPHLGDDVEWLGEIGHAEKYDLLGSAAALVFPIAWPEPFGMVMIEAMACGTPVLATPCGSVPEVVANGVTGLIADDPDALAAAAAGADRFDRHSCRRHVERRFSADAMADSYEFLVHAARNEDTSRQGWGATRPLARFGAPRGRPAASPRSGAPGPRLPAERSPSGGQ